VGKNSPIVATQRLRKKRYRGKEYARNNKRIVGRITFNVASVISRKVGDYFFPELLVEIKIAPLTHKTLKINGS
jgi:hypothetical protein